ncbi:hypothetical protein NWE73_14045 [Bdellovibrio sp. PAP01]|uniref:Uncharacterized protein n=1 Tax=Bdellovibrio svalbardensis TaxID=2972972 RepID=A0ABT6DL16_9BACT|nr:hypothetical protein [Bdellovibrio svalbardensis]
MVSQKSLSSNQQILIVEDASALSSKFDSLKKYKLISNLSIKADSLSSSDFIQKGTSQGLIVIVQPTASDREFDLYVSVSAAAGTVEFELPEGSVEFQDGSVNTLTTSPALTNTLAMNHSRLALGEEYVCYSDVNKKVRCLGSYYGGQTGKGDSSEGEQYRGFEVNTSLISGSGDFYKVSGASYSSCGLSSEGTLYCWGDNYSNELGVGTGDMEVLRPTPVAMTNVAGEKRFIDFDMDFESLCAVSAVGDLFCSGVIDATSSLVPVKVDLSGLSGTAGKVAQVSVGREFACGVTSDGRLFCFGKNDQGQLGNGSMLDSVTPVYVDVSGVAGIQKFVQVSLGMNHACAVTVESVMYCWGDNSTGQLGNGTQVDSAIPIAVNTAALVASEKFVMTSVGHNGSCGISNLGKIYCFGDNWHYLTGNGSASDAWSPVAVDSSALSGGAYFTGVALHEGRTCATSSDGGLYCWGDPYADSSFKDNPAYQPQEISTSALPMGQYWDQVITSDASYKKGVALISSDGTGYVWGASVPGINADVASVTPIDVSTMSGSTKFKKIALGFYTMCGISFDDKLHCAGSGAAVGQGGTVTSVSTLTPVDTSSMTGATTFSDVDIAQYVACGVATDGVGYCWGGSGASDILYNPGLGNGSSATKYKPYPISVGAIPGSKLFSKIVVTSFHVCGLMTDQKVYCWGNSNYNRTGNSSGTSVYTPQALNTSGMTGSQLFSDIHGTTETFCGVSADNIVYCWGDSRQGQLGNNSFATSTTPVAVSMGGLAAAAAPLSVKGGPGSSCGILDAAFNIYCWGAPGNSVLTENNSATPVLVDRTGMNGSPVRITSGGNLFVTTSTNKIYCIGWDCNLGLYRTKPTKQYYESF